MLAGKFFFQILQPTHFISEITFLSESFPRFKTRRLTQTHCEIPQMVEVHMTLCEGEFFGPLGHLRDFRPVYAFFKIFN